MSDKKLAKLLEETVLVEGINKPVIACKAGKKGFKKAGFTFKPGEKFLLVRSSSHANRYYVVAWSEEIIFHPRDAFSWVCSCGAGSKEHTHTKTAKMFDTVTHYIFPKRDQLPQSLTPGAGWLARGEEGMQKQRELSRRNKEEFNVKLREIKASQTIAS